MGKCIGAPAAEGGWRGSPFVRSFLLFNAICLASLAACGGGCQGVQPIKTSRLIEHQALIDFSGLRPAAPIPELKVDAASPRSWEAMPPSTSALYTHYQWRSPSARTGVGAAYLRLPLPISASAVLWFAKQQYASKSADGKLIRQWTDALGRNWFEAENDKYHVRGYCIAQGFEAWIVYWGYRTNQPPEPTEISLASRCADTFVPRIGRTPQRPLPDKEAATQPVGAP